MQPNEPRRYAGHDALIPIDAQLSSSSADPLLKASDSSEDLLLLLAEEVTHALGLRSRALFCLGFSLLLLQQLQ